MVKEKFGFPESRLKCAPSGCVGTDNEPFLSTFPDATVQSAGYDCETGNVVKPSGRRVDGPAFEALVQQVNESDHGGGRSNHTAETPEVFVIEYRESLAGIRQKNISATSSSDGRIHPLPKFISSCCGCFCVAPFDSAENRVVGFITAVSDGILSAYIPAPGSHS